jgi:dTDP-4-dehydrorhamnose 3,5-epimerase-like enzyme
MENIQIINLPKIEDPRGNLSFIEEENHIPFKIKRTYWIYDVPGGQIRGGHAFREQKEFIVALSGSLDLIINDGEKTEKYHLNRSYYGIYIPNGIWRHMENFSTNTLVVVLSSTFYNENDYVRNFKDFKALNGK